MAKKKKRKINKQKVFSFVSLIFIVICILWYGGRFIYFYLDSKKTSAKEANIFAKVLLNKNLEKNTLKQVKEDYYFKGNKFFDGKWNYCETFKLTFDDDNKLIDIENIK